jgi:hypothetical protein
MNPTVSFDFSNLSFCWWFMCMVRKKGSENKEK